ncbi:MAG: hypothetical protein BWK76_22710 [Desulfobulbaceae bacterium A2]|nr:MAG: hypothetical protein BWK76_22710 [Desulfobulbaceae bacterium A2]
MKQILALCKKELRVAFGSPMAAIFIASFLIFSFFVFFWLETFFARNSADLRPLFRWMPLLLLFLVSTLTMRQWSEEQKLGTLEILRTLPVSPLKLVLGKLLAVLLLVSLALGCTLVLPLSISWMGLLDWGPVWGGYLGALLLALVYGALGLFVSSRTDNQIVALIVSMGLGIVLYLPGAAPVLSQFDGVVADLLRALGSGSRFAAIERGVLDPRDIVYYLSLAAAGISANVFSLESRRWSSGQVGRKPRRLGRLVLMLVLANLLAANVWLAKLRPPRLDLTADRIATITGPSRDLLATLQEPLLLRGYFSEKTHPLLAPLMPRIRDLLQEYAAAGGGRVRLDWVDPRLDEAAAAEANRQFGIQPIPFQVAGRNEMAVVNSYFHLLVKYGDQYEVLGFRDLVEIEPRQDGQPDVRLRNLEYDLTRTIKKVAHGFQSLGSIFSRINEAGLTVLLSSRNLPDDLQEVPGRIQAVAAAINREVGGKLKIDVIDPDSGGLSRERLEAEYGVKPMLASLFGDKSFYLHLFLTLDGRRQPVQLGGTLSEAEIRSGIEAAVKRQAAGFLKTVGLVTPAPAMPEMAMMGRPPENHYRMVEEVLRDSYNVKHLTLAEGWVAGEIDALVLLTPERLGAMEQLAVDQYLMRGGSVLALGGAWRLDPSPQGRSLVLRRIEEGVAPLLTEYGVLVGEGLVMDPRNEPFPVPVSRDLGGISVQEIRRIDYPYFVDVRPDAMAHNHPVTASLPAVTLHWVSPLGLDEEKRKGYRVVELLHSSGRSWVNDAPVADPDFTRYPGNGFPSSHGKAGAQLLAVAMSGSFPSYFNTHPDPRLEQKTSATDDAENAAAPLPSAGKKTPPSREAEKSSLQQALIGRSPDSARLVVVGSGDFVNDALISMSQSLGQDRYLNNLALLQNLVDWSVEDEELLAIRSRGAHARLLLPFDRGTQRFLEGINYGGALIALGLAVFLGGRLARRERPLAVAVHREERS